MLKIKRKALLIILSLFAVCFICSGALSLNMAYASNIKVRISSEGKGYVSSNEMDIDANSSVSVCFDNVYTLDSGDTYVGFGIVKADSFNQAFLDESNSDAGYCVLFDKETTVIGGGTNSLINERCDKNEVLRENYTYKATFDNKNGVFFLERKATGSNAFAKVQSVTNIDKLPDGKYVIGIMYSENFEMVAENIEFTTEENEFGEMPYSDGYKNENGEVIYGITKTENDAFTLLESDGISCYANNMPISADSNGKVVITLKTSMYDFDDATEIGFAMGTKERDGVIFTGDKGVCFSLGKMQGIKKYSAGSFEAYQPVESNLNLSSLFSSNRAIKAVFNVNDNSFLLMVRFNEGSEFVEVLKVENLSLYRENFFVGIQFNGKAKIKLSELSVFKSRELGNYADRVQNLHADQRNLTVTKNADSTTTFSLHQETFDAGKSHECMYTPEPIVTTENESVIIYFEDIKDIVLKNPGYSSKASFIFSNTCKFPTEYMYSNNTSFSMFYESTRCVYYIVDKENDSHTTNSLGYSNTFTNIFKKGNSVMAVFTPAYQRYSLYVRTALEPDFSLWQTYSVDKNSGVTINNTLYVGFELIYGMDLTVGDYGVYVADSNKVGVTPPEESDMTGSGNDKKGGFTITASGPSYATFSNIDISDCDAVALEYSMENISSADGSYLMGFMITDGDRLPTKPFVLNRLDNSHFMAEEGEYIKGTKSVLYCYVPTAGLTVDLNGKMRNYLFHSGYRIRAVFSFSAGTTTIQYMDQTANTWNDIAVYDDLLKYESTDKITIALRLQNTVSLSLNGLSAYKIKNAVTSTEYVSDNTEEIESAVMCNIKAFSDDENRGTVYIDEEGQTEVGVLSGAILTLNAVSKGDNIFKGWYLDGQLVSEEESFDITPEKSFEYEAKFVPSSRIIIKNGFDNYFTETDKRFEANKYVGINPQSVYGYEFVGWEISTYMANEEGTILLSRYLLSRNDTKENNLLSDVRNDLNIWKSLTNKISGTGSCEIEKNEAGRVLIKFDKFDVVDRKGYDNGALMISVPEMENKYVDGELVLENYVELVARYEEKDLIESGSFETGYGENYEKNYAITKKWFIVIASLTVGLVAVMVVIKIIILKKTSGRK